MTYRHISWHLAHGEDGTPYLFRGWIGRLRLHIFYRGDQDRDPHDHPWGFRTFPLTSYAEEVTVKHVDGGVEKEVVSYEKHTNIVRAFRLHYRPATYLHRVRNRVRRQRNASNPDAWEDCPGKIYTLVWREGWKRDWGFLKTRDGRTCWQYWRDYVFNGGRNAPCGDE